MNITTITGIIFGITVLLSAIFGATKDVSLFVNLPGISIVLGGVIASTFICYPLKDVFRVFNVFLATLKKEELPIGNYIHEIQYLAQRAMVKGTLKLEHELEGMENFFLKDGIQMIVDHYPAAKIREIMETTIDNTYYRELREASIFRTMAKFAPAFGMVGTLIGLITLLQNMGDLGSKEIGQAMALALVTTFYGIILANLFFFPIALKYEQRVQDRKLLMTIIMEGLILITEKTPPDLIKDKLKAYLPPRKWTSIKSRDSKKPLKVEVSGNA